MAVNVQGTANDVGVMGGWFFAGGISGIFRLTWRNANQRIKAGGPDQQSCKKPEARDDSCLARFAAAADQIYVAWDVQCRYAADKRVSERSAGQQDSGCAAARHFF